MSQGNPKKRSQKVFVRRIEFVGVSGDDSQLKGHVGVDLLKFPDQVQDLLLSCLVVLVRVLCLEVSFLWC